MRCLERKKDKATQHNRKTKQHNTTHAYECMFCDVYVCMCLFHRETSLETELQLEIGGTEGKKLEKNYCKMSSSEAKMVCYTVHVWQITSPVYIFTCTQHLYVHVHVCIKPGYSSYEAQV